MVVQPVDFDYDAVDFVVQQMAAAHDVLVEIRDLRRRCGDAAFRADCQSLSVGLAQAGQVSLLEGRRVVQQETEVGDFGAGLQAAQCAGGGVPGVGVQRQSLLFPGFLQFGKSRFGEMDFTPVGALGRAGRSAGVGQAGDGPGRFGDVLADGAVAAGGGLLQDAVPVLQPQGDAVDFEFADQRRTEVIQLTADALVPLVEIGFAEGVGQAEHGFRVGYGAESGASAGSLRRRVRRGRLRFRCLHPVEFGDQGIVVGIADYGGLEFVVAVVVMADPGAYPVGRGLRGLAVGHGGFLFGRV